MKNFKKTLVRIGKRRILEKVSDALLTTITLLIIVGIITFVLACINSMRGLEVDDGVINLLVVIIMSLPVLLILFIPIVVVHYLTQHIANLPELVVRRIKFRYIILSCKSLNIRLFITIAVISFTYIYTGFLEVPNIWILLGGNAIVGFIGGVLSKVMTDKYLKKLYKN